MRYCFNDFNNLGCQAFLASSSNMDFSMFEENKWRLCDVVTRDESWFYHRQIGRKQSNASLVAEGESQRTVVRQGRFEP